MYSRVEEIRMELTGKTEMTPSLEADLIERIARVEESEELVPSMKKADLILGLLLAASMGIVPVILVGMNVI